MQDVLSFLPHLSVMLLLILVHCALTFGLPIPGCPTYVSRPYFRTLFFYAFYFNKNNNEFVCCRGYLGPGGRHEDGKYFNCTGGAAGYIDKTILTLNHIYQNPTIKYVYGSNPFDPEGILGNFCCFITVIYV